MAGVPPQIQEKIARLQQAQQTLDALLLQKQQVEMELRETEAAISELEKPVPAGVVYKMVGRILVRAEKDPLLNDLRERRELLTVRQTSLGKQETRVRERLNEIQADLRGALGAQAG